MHLCHRRDEALALWLWQRGEHDFGCSIGAPIHLLDLGEPRGSETGAANSLVIRSRAQSHQARRFQRTDHSAQIARIESEPRTQVAKVSTRGTNLEQHARLA